MEVYVVDLGGEGNLLPLTIEAGTEDLERILELYPTFRVEKKKQDQEEDYCA